MTILAGLHGRLTRVGVSDTMVLQFLAGVFSGGLVTQLLDTIMVRKNRALFKNDPVNLLSAASYADALRIDQITEPQYNEYMAELGYSANQSKLFYANTHDFLQKEDTSIRRIAKSFESVFTHYAATPDVDFDQSSLDAIRAE